MVCKVDVKSKVQYIKHITKDTSKFCIITDIPPSNLLDVPSRAWLVFHIYLNQYSNVIVIQDYWIIKIL